jgi:aspartyl/asparaginyl-tRNA synthetase
MRRFLFIAMGLLLGTALTVPSVAAGQASQKEEKLKAADQTRIDGTVHMIDSATKTITVRVRGKTDQRQVVYTDKTEITFRNKAAKLEEVKEGRRVIVLGKVNDKNQLVATRIDVRDES